jgi:hypothetical protein
MTRLLTIAVALAATALIPTAALAKHGGDNRKQVSGSCTGNATSKLKAKPDDGQIEVQFEVDSNVVGQTWQFRLKDNGVVFASGTRVTQAPSGSFEVRRLTADQAGTDTIVGQARNPSTGETCRGTVTL